MYVLLVPPVAVAITLLVIGIRRLAVRSRPVDAIEAHRRCLEALDPLTPSRKAAQQAREESPKLSRIHRPA